MVNIATCRGAYTAGFLDMMSQHAKRRVSKCFVLEERASLFSREDDMEPNLGERLGHVNGSFLTAGPLALCVSYVIFPQAVGLG